MSSRGLGGLLFMLIASNLCIPLGDMTESTTMPPTTPIPLTLIVCATLSNGIGRGSTLPWRLPQEMAWFANVTSSLSVAGGAKQEGKMNAVVMGRQSWESIPGRFRPLKGRWNAVISRGSGEGLGIPDSASTSLAASLPEALSSLPTDKIHHHFLIGGSQLYTHALTTPSHSYAANRILLTRILEPAFADCDVFFPEIRPGFEGALEGWRKCETKELIEWVGEGVKVPLGRREEKGCVYEMEMWVKDAV